MSKNNDIADIFHYEDKDYKLACYKNVYSGSSYWVLVDNKREILGVFEEGRTPAYSSDFEFMTATSDDYIVYVFNERERYPNDEHYFIKFGKIKKIYRDAAFVKELYSTDISDFYKKYYHYRYNPIQRRINTFMSYNADIKYFCMITRIYNYRNRTINCPMLLWKIGSPSEDLIIDNDLTHRITEIGLQYECDLIEDYLQIINEDQMRLGITIKSEKGDLKSYSLIYDLTMKIITAVEPLTVQVSNNQT
jgi:hypothetical protein